jgi:molecular chaperone HtpG
MLKEHGMEAVIADTMIDVHFIPYFEMQTGRKWKFKRVDADVSALFLDNAKPNLVVDAKDQATAGERVEKLFKDNLERKQIKVRVESFKSEKVPAMLIFDENTRRMKEMARSNGAMAAYLGQVPDDATLVINATSPAVKNLLRLSLSFNRAEEVKMVVNQIYDLAWLQQGELTADMMQAFIDRSTWVLGRLGSADSSPVPHDPTGGPA